MLHRTPLIEAYVSVGVPLDNLPHTPEMDAVRDRYATLAGEPADPPDQVWCRLSNLRKSGDLPRLGRGGRRRG